MGVMRIWLLIGSLGILHVSSPAQTSATTAAPGAARQVSTKFRRTSTAALPVIFVHGNGDDASRWIATRWLFESNGYPADRLFAIRFHDPVARIDDTREEANRSGTAQAMDELGRYVQDVLHRTGAEKVVLVGSSRGGLTIRNYVQNGGGSAFVHAEVLCGTPNHGVNASATNRGNEFNGQGEFLSKLNQPGTDGSEVTAGVRTLTLRSDRFDKYAQPTGVGLGRPDAATGITFEGPALRGAENLVLPGQDHREVAFSNEAFAAMFRFITGHPAATLTVRPQQSPTLSGLVTGFAGAAATNNALPGIHLRVAEVRSGAADKQVYETTTGADGAWGPFRADPRAEYSFDLESDGRHVLYFLPPLPRSTDALNLRFVPPSPVRNRSESTLLISRPRGYFSRERDPVRIDGQPTQAEPAGLPVSDSFVVDEPATVDTVSVTLRGETVLAHPSASDKVLSIVEFLR